MKKDEMREHTMKRIDAMGFKAPLAWKDELYRNELTKLDLKTTFKMSETSENDSQRYFDKALVKNFENLKRVMSSQVSKRSTLPNRIQPDLINCSGAKNLKKIRQEGKIIVHDETRGGSSISSSKLSLLKEMKYVEKVIITETDR